ncbi:MAG TPA: chemotaxis protein CheC [Myxococcota bacterium]|jgi:chemotaxis protein CheC
MSATATPGAAERRQRLRELAGLGAQRASEVLAEMAGTGVQVGPLKSGAALEAPAFETGVIFRIEGEISGQLALCFDLLARRTLVRLLLDEDEPEAAPDMVASALCELANIVASQTVSAIANVLGARVSLSVPELRLERAGARLFELRAEQGEGARDLVFVNELSAPAAELRVLLAIAPDA